MTNLIGQYQIDKHTLKKTDIQLVIGTRKQPSPTKPKNYLLQKIGQSFKYVSSIYPVIDKEGKIQGLKFEFDTNEGKYLLTMNQAANEAEIMPCEEVVVSIP